MTKKQNQPGSLLNREGQRNNKVVYISYPLAGLSLLCMGCWNTVGFLKVNQPREIRKHDKKLAIEAAFKSAKAGSFTDKAHCNGTCAATELVSKAGLAPRFLPGMFFEPPFSTSWKAADDVLTTDASAAASDLLSQSWVEDVLANRKAEKSEHSFFLGESVFSRHTCQETLFLKMCPERNC